MAASTSARHQGFGQGLTGPQYIEQLLRDFPKQVELQCATTALSISKNKVAVLSGAKTGLQRTALQLPQSWSHSGTPNSCISVRSGV